MMQTTRLIRRRIDLVSIGFLLAISPASAEIRSLVPTPLVTIADDLYGWPRLKIAPDNTKVFFLAQEQPHFIPSPTRLFEVPVDAGPIATRTYEADGYSGSVLDFGFTPDGKNLVIKEDIDCLACYSGDVFVMPVADGLPQKLTFDGGVEGSPVWQPVFSHDGSRLLFRGVNLDRQIELYSIPLDGSASTTRLSNPLPFPGEVRSDWKLRPNSNEVLYVAPWAGDIGYNLFRANALGGGPQRVNLTDDIQSTGRATTNTFAVDSTGSSVAYGVYPGPAGLPTVMSRQLAGGPEIDLAPGLAKHDDIQIQMYGFARDLVVFEADFNNAYRYELYAAAADGGPAKNITVNDSYVADSAVISPNGDAVIYATYANSVWPPYPDTEREVLLYDVTAGSVRSLGVYPANGNLPSYQFNAAGDQFVMGGKLFTAEGEFVRSFDDGFDRFHPDGEHFFYLAYATGTPTNWGELFVERLDGTGDTVHVSNDSLGGPGVLAFTLSSDAKTLFYSRTQFGQPLQIFAVQLAPEPGSAIIAVVAVTWMGVIRRTRSRSSI
jgi:Tol biopolymer transport system component